MPTRRTFLEMLAATGMTALVPPCARRHRWQLRHRLQLVRGPDAPGPRHLQDHGRGAPGRAIRRALRRGRRVRMPDGRVAAGLDRAVRAGRGPDARRAARAVRRALDPGADRSSRRRRSIMSPASRGRSAPGASGRRSSSDAATKRSTRWRTGRSSTRQWRTALTRAKPWIEAHALPVGIENHKDWLGPELAGWLKRLDSPYVGACLDFGNNVALLEDPMEIVEALAPLVVTTHLKDMAVTIDEDGLRAVGGAARHGDAAARPDDRSGPPRAAGRALLPRDDHARSAATSPTSSDRYWVTRGPRDEKAVERFVTDVLGKAWTRPLPATSGLAARSSRAGRGREHPAVRDAREGRPEAVARPVVLPDADL